MLSKSKLESYLVEMEKGRKTLTSYNYAFSILGAMIACIAILALGILGVGLMEQGFFDALTMDSLGTILKENKPLLYIGFVGGGAMLLSVLTFKLHSYLLKRKMNLYIKNHHELILDKHKEIFKDHSDESIKAFHEEREKDKILETVNTQIKNISFVINNYENLDGQYEDTVIEYEEPVEVEIPEEKDEIMETDEEVEKI